MSHLSSLEEPPTGGVWVTGRNGPHARTLAGAPETVGEQDDSRQESQRHGRAGSCTGDGQRDVTTNPPSAERMPHGAAGCCVEEKRTRRAAEGERRSPSVHWRPA